MDTAFLDTPLGTAEVAWDDMGFSRVNVLSSPKEPGTSTAPAPSDISAQLKEYFTGGRRAFNLRLHPQGSVFQKSVWVALLTIPYGSTISYMQLARQMGDPLAIRAIARAIGQNPFWIIIPCHRVVGSDGSLVGYAAEIWRKQWLLEHENPNPQQRLF